MAVIVEQRAISLFGMNRKPEKSIIQMNLNALLLVA
jgi:hypothetical protein